MNFYCIGDEDTVRGFRLAGVEGRVVTTPAEAAEALTESVGRTGCVLVMLTQEAAAWVRAAADAFRLERDRPLLVEIPGPDGPLAGRKSLSQLAQAAVGVRVEKGKEIR